VAPVVDNRGKNQATKKCWLPGSTKTNKITGAWFCCSETLLRRLRLVSYQMTKIVSSSNSNTSGSLFRTTRIRREL